MELRHLRYFLAVAEEENITRAAARLHVSQPPLSRQIRDLEEDLGVTLFERGGKSVRLTEAGRVFYQEARAVIERAAQARNVVKAFSGPARAVVHLGYAPSLSLEILPRVLRSLEQSHPGIRVELKDMSSEEMVSGLLDDTLDAAMIVRMAKPWNARLQFHELAQYAVCVAAAPTHPISKKNRPGLRDVFSERLLGYSRKDYPEYGYWIESLSGKPVEPAEEHDSATSLIASVESGRGVALVPETFSCFSGQRVSVIPIHPPPEPMKVGLATRKRKANAAVRALLDAAALTCGKSPG